MEPGVEGLVHISHLADRHVAKPDEVVTEGEEVSVKVLSVDTVEKRIRLSIREVNSEPRPAREPRQSKQEVAEPKVEEVKEDNLTLGDVFGDMFKKEQ
ncbi:hypothetical protein N752_22400 [Desulforamulus aquiferis]|nr:S1 RNA-binding domain-containing protein [Desulforamulus aquiferis]RYD02940.1 hypothetical protein N752_22400 [Desulforamulus aquiferis]